jgi:hypothetical protein
MPTQRSVSPIPTCFQAFEKYVYIHWVAHIIIADCLEAPNLRHFASLKVSVRKLKVAKHAAASAH